MGLNQPEAIPGAQDGAAALVVIGGMWVGASAVWLVITLAWAYCKWRRDAGRR